MRDIQEKLLQTVHEQMEKGLDKVSAAELGEVIDMIKDMSETMYYTSVVNAMENGALKEDLPPISIGKYSDGYAEGYAEGAKHDEKEGKSGAFRKTYIESREQHKDNATKLKDLDEYLNMLSTDIAELLENMTPEERTMIKVKMGNITNKL